MTLPNLTEIPCWYILVATIVSLYYAWRGAHANYRIAAGQKAAGADGIVKHLSKAELFWIYSFHDFIFHLVCSLSGFLTLYILSQCHTIASTEDSIFVVFLSLYTIVGITDMLPQLLPQGKFPGR